MPASTELRIAPVADRRSLEQFIRTPWQFYYCDPFWVPPLLMERRDHLNERKNPYFRHAQWQAWTAWRGDRPVGRISAQLDRLHLERYDDATGFFGMLEAEDRRETFEALLSTAEEWLAARGMQRVRGPMNLSVNQETGLLVEGFDTPPPFMLGHARAYYAGHVEALGYAKANDLLAYRLRLDFELPAAVKRLLARMPQVRTRPVRRKAFAEDLEIMRDIFNDAWAENWSFVPFTREEFQHLGSELKPLVPRDFIRIAELDGEPAAMMITLPDLNDLIRDLNGRLVPFGWAKLAWRLLARRPRAARVPLMGVRQRYQRTRVGTALAFLMIDECRRPTTARGIWDSDLSWILEDNRGMRDMLEAVGARAYKRFRVYDKSLTGR